MTVSNKARVFIIDDHPCVREGMKQILERQPDFLVCGVSADGQDILKKIKETKPDILSIDISLEGRSGLDLVKQIKSHYPDMKILVVSMHDEALFARRALAAGAMGYLMKASPPETIVEALREILNKKVYVSKTMTEKILDTCVDRQSSVVASSLETLSDREFEIFSLIGDGYRVGEIAEKLALGVKTIETYQERIKTKLNLSTSKELLRYAIHHKN